MVYDGPFVFMLMGHAYEFERDDNWNVIEEFLQEMGGRDDVWYATCGQIIRAQERFERLEYSADGTWVYNPSFDLVWVKANGRTLKIEGGARVRLDGNA